MTSNSFYIYNPTNMKYFCLRRSVSSMALSLYTRLSLYALISLFVHFAIVSANQGRHSHHHHPLHRTHSNPHLLQAYTALQEWKRVIYSDPNNFTTDWVGPSICDYTGIFCGPSPSNPKIPVVAGIDLNHGDIAGFLPEALGLLSDLALLHLNSNRFCGILPRSLTNLTHLYELDLSNNRFVGPFPSVVLSLSSLKYLDLRYNEFEGPLPSQLFNKDLDAIFVNNNRFTKVISSDFNGTSASVVVFANNNFRGCLPPSIARLANTLEELLLINTSLSGCLPPEVGYLYKLRVLDVSYNSFVGPIPYSLAGLAHLEVLNLQHNRMSGVVPQGVCLLPDLSNVTLSYNYFCEEEGICQNLTSRGIAFDDRQNCLPHKHFQRSQKVCQPVIEHPIDCYEDKCSAASAPIAPAPVPAYA